MFYRDSNGNEVDIVLPRGQEYVPIEVKSAATASRALMKGLRAFLRAVPGAADPTLVYAGEDTRYQEGTRMVNLSSLHQTVDELLPPS